VPGDYAAGDTACSRQIARLHGLGNNGLVVVWGITIAITQYNSVTWKNVRTTSATKLQPFEPPKFPNLAHYQVTRPGLTIVRHQLVCHFEIHPPARISDFACFQVVIGDSLHSGFHSNMVLIGFEKSTVRTGYS
jgi:hypothetical protein